MNRIKEVCQSQVEPTVLREFPCFYGEIREHNQQVYRDRPKVVPPECYNPNDDYAKNLSALCIKALNCS